MPAPEETGAVKTAEVTEVKPTEETPALPETKEEAPQNPTEIRARAKGWKPKEEYSGTRPWVDAETFLDREPLIERISSQGKHIAELTKTVNAMANHFRKSVDHEVGRRIADLKSQKTEAIKEGDVEKVERIDKAIEAQQHVKADIPTTKEIAPEVRTWVERNPWYLKDNELHDFALAYNDSYLKRHPGDIEGSLKATSEATRKAFPDRFKSDEQGDNGREPAAGRRAATVESGGTVPTGRKSYSVSRLNTEQRLAHDQYVKAGVFTSEEYIKALDEMGELTK